MTKARNPRRFLVVTADTAVLLKRLGMERGYPRQDFRELAEALDARILSFSDLTARAGPLVRLTRCLLGKGTALAVYAFQQRGTFYFSTAENTGFPLAFLLKFRPNTRHVMIAHKISAQKKRLLAKVFCLFNQIDRMICYSHTQAEYARNYLGVPLNKLKRIDFQVDPAFFSPAPTPRATMRRIVSVGRELRDYPTLFAAIQGTDIQATVVASSPWSKRRDRTRKRTMPQNVVIRTGLAYHQLRELYRQCRAVVVPLLPVDSPAGITTILEAQAVGKPVIVSASPGILDSIVPGKNAVTVPCGDANALRQAILDVFDNPDNADALAAAGRHTAVKTKTIDLFVQRIVSICAEIGEASQAPGAAGKASNRLA